MSAAFLVHREMLYLQVAPSLCFREVGGGIFETGLDRALLSDSEISVRPPLPGDGILLGGRSCDLRIYYDEKQSVKRWQAERRQVRSYRVFFRILHIQSQRLLLE
jgi:hypothetical protein